jgi:hypothetical protein
MTPTSDISKYLEDDKCVLRDTESHLKQRALLTGQASEHYSKVYGINKQSCLMDIAQFSLFYGRLPHDNIVFPMSYT